MQNFYDSGINSCAPCASTLMITIQWMPLSAPYKGNEYFTPSPTHFAFYNCVQCGFFFFFSEDMVTFNSLWPSDVIW